jgi:hypothetical protein
MRSLWLTPPRYWKGSEIADELKSWCIDIEVAVENANRPPPAPDLKVPVRPIIGIADRD